MSKKTRGPRRPRPKSMRLVGAEPTKIVVPAPRPVQLREGVPVELHLRDPIPGPDGEPTTVLVQNTGMDWLMVAFMVLDNANPKQGVLVPAYQVSMFDDDGNGWLVTVPLQNVVASRTPVRREPPEPPEPAP